MTMHLDLAPDDLAAARGLALELGATLAAIRPQAQNRVLLDPARNPFCLGEDES
jgi:hypothetical protein